MTQRPSYIVAWRYSGKFTDIYCIRWHDRQKWKAYHKLESAVRAYNNLAGKTSYRCLSNGTVLKECGKLQGYRW